jgi:hypothetical protein
LPPLSQLVDAGGNVWTLASNGHILRNGAWAAGGLGSKLLWFGGAIYTLGSDINWWQWQPALGTWGKVGPTQPGTGGGGTPTPPSTSPDGSMLPPLSQIVDASGGVWAIQADGHLIRNGLWAGGGLGSKLLWVGGAMYTLGTDAAWWQWQPSSATWTRVGPTQPGTSPAP